MRTDEVLKRYLSDNARYADLINGMVFGGRQVVKPEDLNEKDSQIVDSNKQSKYRDLIRKTAFGVNFAVVGVENQSHTHYLMPIRAMYYDAMEYHRQAGMIRNRVKRTRKWETEQKGIGVCITKDEFLSGFCKTDRLHPCVTLVLFYGEEWDGSRDLYGILDFTDIPKELKGLINNYHINLLEIRKLEQTDVYQTDIKQVFDFIRYSKDEVKLRELVQGDPAYQHMDPDAYDVAVEFTRADELIAKKQEYIGKKEDVNMCEALTKMLQNEREEGREEGALGMLSVLVQKGLLELTDAAAQMQMTPEAFEARMKQYLTE